MKLRVILLSCAFCLMASCASAYYDLPPFESMPIRNLPFVCRMSQTSHAGSLSAFVDKFSTYLRDKGIAVIKVGWFSDKYLPNGYIIQIEAFNQPAGKTVTFLIGVRNLFNQSAEATFFTFPEVKISNTPEVEAYCKALLNVMNRQKK